MASSRAFCALAAILPRRLARSEYLVPEGSSVRFRESRSMHASSVRALSRPAPAHRSRTVFGGRERDVTREERCAPQDSRSSRAATPVPQTPPRATPDLSPPSPSVSRTPATETGHAPRGLRPRRPGDARALQVRLRASPAPCRRHAREPPFRDSRDCERTRARHFFVDADEGREKPNRVSKRFFVLGEIRDDVQTLRRLGQGVASYILTTARVSNTSLTCAVRLFFFQKSYTAYTFAARSTALRCARRRRRRARPVINAAVAVVL